MTGVLALSALLQSTAGLALASSYTYDCDTGFMPAANYHMFVQKETTLTTDEFVAVSGEAYGRDRATCFAGNPQSGFSGVFPANLQQFPTGGGLVQIGFYEDSTMNNTIIAYTASDHGVAGQCGGQPGCLFLANWYHNGAAVCTTCLYRFRIQQSGVNQWEICVRNKTTGEAYVCTNITKTWPLGRYAQMAWWLYETDNSADAIGRTNTGLIHLQWLQYRREGSITWLVRDNMGNEPPPYDYNAQGGCRGWSSTPGWYHCGITNEIDQDGNGSLDDHDGLDAWTTLH